MMHPSPEQQMRNASTDVVKLAAEHETSPKAIRTLLHKGIPPETIGDILEIRGYLSRDGFSITGRGNRNNDIVSVAAVAEAYHAVNGDIDDLRRLAELTLRHVTSRTVFMRGAFTRALHFTSQQFRVYGGDMQKLEESFENGTINPFPDVLYLEVHPDDEDESPLSAL